MNPNQKANKLIEQFAFAAGSFIEGKKCAIVHIDILISELPIHIQENNPTRVYLNDVKREIKNKYK